MTCYNKVWKAITLYNVLFNAMTCHNYLKPSTIHYNKPHNATKLYVNKIPWHTMAYDAMQIHMMQYYICYAMSYIWKDKILYALIEHYLKS